MKAQHAVLWTVFSTLVCGGFSAAQAQQAPPALNGPDSDTAHTAPIGNRDLGNGPGFALPGKSLAKIGRSAQLSQQSDDAARHGATAQAKSLYQQALALWPDNKQALYGLGTFSKTAGDTAAALSCYRRAIYTDDPSRYGSVPGDGYQENNPDRLMEFVLLLSQTGHGDEALSVYHRTLTLLNYRDGRQNLKVLLPEFGMGPGQSLYTPRRLQAMALVGLSVDLANQGSDGVAVREANLREAARLWPESPIPYFYLGVEMTAVHWDEARAAYGQAARLSDGQAATGARAALKEWPLSNPDIHDYAPASPETRRLLGVTQPVATTPGAK